MEPAADRARLLRDLDLALTSYGAHLEEVRQGLVPAAPRDPGNGLKPLVDREAVRWLLGALGSGAPAEAWDRASALDAEFDRLQADRPDYWPRLAADLETLAESLAARGVAVALLSSRAEFLDVLAERTYIQILAEALEPRGGVGSALRRKVEAEESPFRAFVERHRAAGFDAPAVPYAPPRFWWLVAVAASRPSRASRARDARGNISLDGP